MSLFSCFRTPPAFPPDPHVAIRSRARLPALGLWIALAAATGACGGDGPGAELDASAGATDDSCTGPWPFTCFGAAGGGNCGDAGTRPLCQKGQWVCPAGTIEEGFCGCFGAQRSDCSCQDHHYVCPDPDGGRDAGDPCAACTGDEICVQFNDSSSICRAPTATVFCSKVSAACLAMIRPGSQSCPDATDACQAEICGGDNTRCRPTAPCGNEIPQARIRCYGP